jgi:uncharacterized protein YaiE (UPF0345 family)
LAGEDESVEIGQKLWGRHGRMTVRNKPIDTTHLCVVSIGRSHTDKRDHSAKVGEMPKMALEFGARTVQEMSNVGGKVLSSGGSWQKLTAAVAYMILGDRPIES